MTLEERLNQRLVIKDTSDEVGVVIVGDTHFNYIAPRSRIDDYPDTCVKKLDKLRNICKQRGFKYVVFLGDIFHKPKQPVDYLFKVVTALKLFWADGISCYTISGNHDLYNERLDSLERSALGLFLEIGVLVPFHELSFQNNGSMNLYGFHYSEEAKPVMEWDSESYPIGDINVFVAHMFYEFDLSKDSLQKKDIVNLGYDIYCLGHDHVTYPLEQVGSASIVRPGSFMRGTSHKYNLERDVCVDVLRFKNKSVSVERIPLEVQPADMVFSASVTDKVDLKSMSEDLKSQFTSLITMLETPKTEGVTVYKIMDEMVMSPEVKGRIEQYLTDFGVFRPSVVGSEQ